MSGELFFPKVMRLGEGSSRELCSVLQQCGYRKPLVVTDRTMVKLGYIDRINLSADVFEDTEPEPTTRSIALGLKMFQDGDYDSLVALGGGSVIDSAKIISVLAAQGGFVREYKAPRVVTGKHYPVVAIPTTAGTGSEATKVTVISDVETSEKMMCFGPAFVPAAALLDYELTMSVPPRTTADTGIDALSHAVEAYVSRRANLYTDQIALQAMALIGSSLRVVYQDGSQRDARESMMLGAFLAGSAFSNSSVALVHGMSRPIGAFFHVPHGLSNAMLFPTVTAWSLPYAEARYADCAKALGVADKGTDNATAAAALVEELRAFNRDFSVPSPGGFGIAKEKFFAVMETMAEQALASGSPANNPRVPTKAEIVSLYQQVWVSAEQPLGA